MGTIIVLTILLGIYAIYAIVVGYMFKHLCRQEKISLKTFWFLKIGYILGFITSALISFAAMTLFNAPGSANDPINWLVFYGMPFFSIVFVISLFALLANQQANRISKMAVAVIGLPFFSSIIFFGIFIMSLFYSFLTD
jgi:hypothetical protein